MIHNYIFQILSHLLMVRSKIGMCRIFLPQNSPRVRAISILVKSLLNVRKYI